MAFSVKPIAMTGHAQKLDNVRVADLPHDLCFLIPRNLAFILPLQTAPTTTRGNDHQREYD